MVCATFKTNRQEHYVQSFSMHVLSFAPITEVWNRQSEKPEKELKISFSNVENFSNSHDLYLWFHLTEYLDSISKGVSILLKYFR